jgi:peptide deformylase
MEEELSYCAILAPCRNGVNVNRTVDASDLAGVGRTLWRAYNPCFTSFSQIRYSHHGGRPLSLEVIQYPHPTLRHVSRPLKKVDAELRKIVAEMFDLMYAHEGVGLAANQIDLPYRLFVANSEGDPAMKDAEFVFINPVLRKGKGQAEDEEGCLSIPEVRAPVVRNATIEVEAYDLEGNLVHAEAEGLMARILQHETDHLDGKLFIDRLSPTEMAAIKDKLCEFELAFESRRETGELPSDEAITARWRELEQLRT